jgi:hypothetical protein
MQKCEKLRIVKIVIVGDLDQPDAIAGAQYPLPLIPLPGVLQAFFTAKEVHWLKMLDAVIFEGQCHRGYPDISFLAVWSG